MMVRNMMMVEKRMNVSANRDVGLEKLERGTRAQRGGSAPGMAIWV